MAVKPLVIRWQRLVNSEGSTCDRCAGTHEHLVRALQALRASLAPLGVEPVLETVAMDEATFRADPSQSNRLWIAGRPLEEWLEASVGSSRCCAACGDAPCRTVGVEGVTYETIPEDLLFKAALRAASELVDSGEPARAS